MVASVRKTVFFLHDSIYKIQTRDAVTDEGTALTVHVIFTLHRFTYGMLF